MRRCVIVTNSSSTAGQEPPEIDTSVAHSARVWNYFLGGKDYFPADQQAAEMALELMPSLVEAARADRGFLARAVTYQAAEAVAPESRIVYVDNDPLVLVHARALLTSSPQGATSYLEADLRDPDKI